MGDVTPEAFFQQARMVKLAVLFCRTRRSLLWAGCHEGKQTPLAGGWRIRAVLRHVCDHTNVAGIFPNQTAASAGGAYVPSYGMYAITPTLPESF
jgi:hypothetical protein